MHTYKCYIHRLPYDLTSDTSHSADRFYPPTLPCRNQVHPPGAVSSQDPPDSAAPGGRPFTASTMQVVTDIRLKIDTF